VRGIAVVMARPAKASDASDGTGHAVTPAASGDCTLLGGAQLGLALARHPGDFPAAVKEYEREMFQRTSAAARMSADMHELLTSPDAAQKMLAFFRPG